MIISLHHQSFKKQESIIDFCLLKIDKIKENNCFTWVKHLIELRWQISLKTYNCYKVESILFLFLSVCKEAFNSKPKRRMIEFSQKNSIKIRSVPIEPYSWLYCANLTT
jgi:hypothetical protein